MIPLIWAAMAGIATVAVCACWKEIVSWLKDLVVKIKENFAALAISVKHASIVCAKKLSNTTNAILHRTFYKENSQWMERVYERECPEEDVPDYIRKRLETEAEPDVTQEIQQELQLTI